MKYKFFWLAGLVGLSLLCGAEEDKSARGAVKAVQVPEGPKIDGTFNDSVWQKAPLLVLGDAGSKEKGALSTTARLLFDDKFLYVGFECSDPDTDSLKKDCTERGGNVWEDDDVEIFISPDPQIGYKQIALNPANTIFTQSCLANGDKDLNWNAQIESKVTVEKNKNWTVTLSIPLKDLGAFIGKKLTWKFNLTRTQPAHGDLAQQYYSWAVLPVVSFHQPETFAALTDVTIEEKSGCAAPKEETPAK